MSNCLGDIPVSAKVDREMKDYVAEEARRLGVNESEFLRRLLEFHRESRAEELDCPHCAETIVMDLRQ